MDLADWGGMLNLGGLKQFFGFGGAGGVDLQDSIGGSGMFGNLAKLGKSNAAVLGGGLLAAYGLQRGGLSGLGMTTAGGALIGFKYGGAMGAAIGGAIGLGAGLVRLFIKGATEKAREKIKATYGVEIKDKGVLQQVVDIAKQAYGGNLDMAIRTQQVRDLVELYAMSTGQGARGLPAKMTPGSLIQSGGSLFQGAQYSNGSLLPSSGGLPGARLGGSSGQMAVTVVLPEITVRAPNAQDLFSAGVCQAIADNPRITAQASYSSGQAEFQAARVYRAAARSRDADIMTILEEADEDERFTMNVKADPLRLSFYELEGPMGQRAPRADDWASARCQPPAVSRGSEGGKAAVEDASSIPGLGA